MQKLFEIDDAHAGIAVINPTAEEIAESTNAERDDFFERPLAFSCTATQVPNDSFQTDR
ncbi:hypothetical protein [Burkholderia sp. Ac-20365]|uniref:hypothetical protein n=1 Tax=Burkholderia sp. Ac-20365 TaxID=2703897 RepID=UPI001F11E17A|nr:hypothetical protein [Burkholderia sp. Ac-20365]